MSSANTAQVPPYWLSCHHHLFGSATLSLNSMEEWERMTLSSSLLSEMAQLLLGFSKLYFNLYIVTSLHVPTDHRKVDGQLYIHLIFSSPLPSSLFLAYSRSQQPLSPVGSLPWISNHANIYFRNHKQNTSAFSDLSKFIKRHVIWSRCLKNFLIFWMFIVHNHTQKEPF